MNLSAKPLISVVMPVHNAMPFLDESIRSIIEQTFSDFEFMILDDGSTDGSGQLLREWSQRDSRIHLFRSESRKGLSGSSNLIVSKARAAIVARMDADDISHPERLMRQWAVLESQPDVVVVGTLCDGIDAKGRVVRPRDRWRLVRRSQYIPFPHGSAMFRKKAFEVVKGYEEDFAGGEDQNFFFKMTATGRVVTLPDVLYHFRYHSCNATLLNGARGVRAVTERYSENGVDLTAFYLLGGMRLWSGQPPGILPEMLAIESLKWNIETLVALASAAWGSVSPGSLRLFLRSVIRTRDLIAGLHVKDGRPYEWRLE
jgi:glycosyltransferase involved in cell wall biosynthesis